MRDFAEPLTRLVEELERLPGIGARTAERLAFHLLKIEREPAMALARAIRDVKDGLRSCSECFNIAEGERCRICSDPARDPAQICIVEQVKDLLAIENAAAFSGRYHVLCGRVEPQKGRGPEELTLTALRRRIEDQASVGSPVKELILATNPDAEGDATALAVRESLRDLGLPFTRIARGLPSGGSLEFANVEILKDALQGRRRLADEGEGSGG